MVLLGTLLSGPSRRFPDVPDEVEVVENPEKEADVPGRQKSDFFLSLPLRNFQDCTAAGRRNLTCHTGLLGGEPRGKFVRRNCSSSYLGHSDNSASGVRQEDDHAFLCLSNGGNTPFIGKYHLQPVVPRRSSPSRFNFCACLLKFYCL